MKLCRDVGKKIVIIMFDFKKNICFVGAIALLLGVSSCGRNDRSVQSDKVIAVTIPPLQGLVEQIVGEDFAVVCLLPSGSSPESYSPTARQISSLADADYIFTVGVLDFEQQIIKRIVNQQDKVVNTCDGIELLTGCSHSHEGDESAINYSERHHNHHSKASHIHSIDPHIWLAPKQLGAMVDNIAEAIIEDYPDSAMYVANYERLKAMLKEREERYGHLLEGASSRFLIYHPALGYLAKEYGLEQISLENEGKNPTPSTLAEIVDIVQAEGIENLLYQQEYPIDAVKPIAEILRVNLVEINPLSKDIISQLDHIVATLVNNYEE